MSTVLMVINNLAAALGVKGLIVLVLIVFAFLFILKKLFKVAIFVLIITGIIGFAWPAIKVIIPK